MVFARPVQPVISGIKNIGGIFHNGLIYPFTLYKYHLQCPYRSFLLLLFNPALIPIPAGSASRRPL
jgi:hypothetical protein